MNKIFTNSKVGYSCGIYGCSGEYFKIEIFEDEKVHSYFYTGMYGTEDRVANVLKDAGFREIYTGSRYGQLKGDDKKNFNGEQQVIELIKLEVLGNK